MHPSVLDFLRSNLTKEEVCGRRVAEIGSQDVNGTPRPVVMPLQPASYIGIDSAKGPGVDVVVNAGDLCSLFASGAFDIVISTEMLEHVADWRPVVQQMKEMVKVGGLLLMTTRSPGFPYHPYPIDVWRYTLEDARRIFGDMEILVLKNDPQVPGIFLKARKPASFKSLDLSAIEVHRV
jgi:SAM-dependent methyltransferase